MKYKEIENIQELIQLLSESNQISGFAFQNIDFTLIEKLLSGKSFSNCIFLGCKMPENSNNFLDKDNLIFPILNTPYNPYIHTLYTKETLMNNYIIGEPESYEKSLDKIVYNNYLANGKEADDIKETLARRLHDHAITDALYDFLNRYEERKVVAIMGGHDLSRNDSNYLEVTKISKKLTELGYLMISGGGPGAMEATHVGAWFADKDEADLIAAVKILAEAPTYKDKYWLDKAFIVMRDYPHSGYESLGIPTWLYGHEPPTPFATKIAKFFENSFREEGLLAIAKGGVIYAPGSAGTIQEIFQDATQNHYLSFGYASPMVFFNTVYWTTDRPIYPLLHNLALQGKYKNMILSCHDKKEDIVAEILKFST